MLQTPELIIGAARRLAPFVLAVLAFGAPVMAQQTTTTPPATAQSVSDYRVQPGDILVFELWAGKGERLDGRFPVEATGDAYLPQLGQVRAAGLTVEELRRLLRTRYMATYANAVVVITPVFPISVMGAVGSPGIKEVQPGQSLFDAVTAAGGLLPDAKRNEIQLIRDGQTRLVNGLEQMAVEPLKSGDRVMVPRKKGFSVGDASIIVQLIVGVATIFALFR